MQKKIKWLISILLSLVVIASLATTAFAVEPRFSDTHSVKVNVSFIGTTAHCKVGITGADGTTSITNVTITLKDSANNVVGEWLDLRSNGDNFSFYDSVSNLTGNETYTLSVSANVTRKGNIEPVAGSSSNTCPQK